MIDIHKGFDV
jgi:hypothetical protein